MLIYHHLCDSLFVTHCVCASGFIYFSKYVLPLMINKDPFFSSSSAENILDFPERCSAVVSLLDKVQNDDLSAQLFIHLLQVGTCICIHVCCLYVILENFFIT